MPSSRDAPAYRVCPGIPTPLLNTTISWLAKPSSLAHLEDLRVGRFNIAVPRNLARIVVGASRQRVNPDILQLTAVRADRVRERCWSGGVEPLQHVLASTNHR